MPNILYHPTDTLYHYTSFSGLEGILKSGTLWFSDILSMNDPREINLGMSDVISALNDLRHGVWAGPDGLRLSLFAGHLNTYMRRQRLLSCSFSHFGDELPMWEAYADRARGVSIGFRPTAITSMPIMIQRIKYVDENGDKTLRKEVGRILTPLMKAGVGVNTLPWTFAASEIAGLIANLKHKTWSYEREVRCSHAAVTQEDKAFINGHQIPAHTGETNDEFFTPLATRKVGEKEINFAPLDFGLFRRGRHERSGAISEVIIGPRSKASENDITNLLSEFEYQNWRVRQSHCQIR